MKSSLSFRLFCLIITSIFTASTYIPFVSAEDISTPEVTEIVEAQELIPEPVEVVEEVVTEEAVEEPQSEDVVVEQVKEPVTEESVQEEVTEDVVEEVSVQESEAVETDLAEEIVEAPVENAADEETVLEESSTEEIVENADKDVVVEEDQQEGGVTEEQATETPVIETEVENVEVTEEVEASSRSSSETTEELTSEVVVSESAEPVVEEIIEEVVEEKEEEISYVQIMRDFKQEQEEADEEVVEEGILKQLFEGKEKKKARKAERKRKISEKQKKKSEKFSKFLKQEKQRLEEKGISEKRQNKYLKRLEKQQRMLNGEEVLKRKKSKEEKQEVKRPKKPAEFKFENESLQIQSLGQASSFGKKLKKTLSFLPFVDTAVAYDPNYPPTLADVQQDGQEVIINSEIQSLAAELNNNPVDIYNFVRSYISYEPYAGAKKGALGCLQEQVCNDIDTASLTVSLLRAAGIPARYKTALVEVSADQLTSLMGVEDIKTVYASFAWNKVPVYVAEGSVSGSELETADFSQVTSLFIEWTFVQAFMNYDGSTGGNYSNVISFDGLTTTDEVRAIATAYPQMFWKDIDTTFGNTTYTQNEVVHDTANFNTENFWTGFFQYQGTQTPLEKYGSDLQAQASKDPFDAAYTSTVVELVEDSEVLPPALPFKITTSVQPPVHESVLPSSKVHTLTLELTKASDSSVVLTHTFNASEINNEALNINYQGATATDVSTIESYGGIHATPAELVNIVPVFQLDNQSIEGTVNIAIGDTLVLNFTNELNGEVLDESEKFSVAGNSEGVFMTFSRIQENSFLDDETDPNQNSKILLEGNAEIARQYLKRLQENGDALSGSLDVAYNMDFARAVVTQNRVLTEVGGTPTTFDFKGLTLDAYSYVTTVSRRGLYTNNRSDFHFLWGLQASYDEADTFEDITGLEAIATVQGLQSAYNDPATYTVYTITSANESQIDSLSLSANTKANMHADIQSGHTIITPDQLVAEGNWNGLFYVSYLPNGTAAYSIGEQVAQNGAWSIDVLIEGYYNENDVEIDKPGLYVTVKNVDGTELQYSYSDVVSPVSFGGRQCREDYNWIKSVIDTEDDLNFSVEERWKEEYGLPCYKPYVDKYVNSDFQHSYIISAHGVKFYSPESSGDYGYWKLESDIWNIFQIDKSIDADINNVVLDQSSFEFDILSKTYRAEGSATEGDIEMYYKPSSGNGNRGIGYIVYGDVLKKLENVDMIGRQIGYPVSSRKTAYVNGEKEGWYQEFATGAVYIKDGVISDTTYFVPGVIYALYKLNGAHGGDFGFPTDDPGFAGGLDIREQDFEGQTIDVENGVAIIRDLNYLNTGQSLESIKFQEGLVDVFAQYGIALGMDLTQVLGGYALAKYSKDIVPTLVKKYPWIVAKKGLVKFIPYAGWALAIDGASQLAEQTLDLSYACNSYEEEDGEIPAYWCGQLTAYSIAGTLGLVGGVWGISKAIPVKARLSVSTEKAFEGKTNLLNGLKGDRAQENLKKLYKEFDKNDIEDYWIRDRFFERIANNNLDKNQINALMRNERTIKMLTNKKYYANWLPYHRKVLKEIDELPQSTKDKFTSRGLEHILIGEFDAPTGMYDGLGLHTASSLSKGLDNGVFEAFTKDGIRVDSKYIKENANKMLDLKILKKGRSTKDNTFFPLNWSNDDVIDAVVSGAAGKGDGLQEVGIIKNGIPVYMKIDIVGGKIDTAYPDYLRY